MLKIIHVEVIFFFQSSFCRCPTLSVNCFRNQKTFLKRKKLKSDRKAKILVLNITIKNLKILTCKT